MARVPRAFLLALAFVAPASVVRAADDDAHLAALLSAALPADGATNLVAIDQPSLPDAPHVRAATRVGATPATIKDVLLDPAHYRALIPSLVRAD